MVWQTVENEWIKINGISLKFAMGLDWRLPWYFFKDYCGILLTISVGVNWRLACDFIEHYHGILLMMAKVFFWRLPWDFMEGRHVISLKVSWNVIEAYDNILKITVGFYWRLQWDLIEGCHVSLLKDWLDFIKMNIGFYWRLPWDFNKHYYRILWNGAIAVHWRLHTRSSIQNFQLPLPCFQQSI